MACPDEHAFIEFIQGRLAPNAEEDFDGHVAGCPSCRALLGALVHTGSGRGPAALESRRQPASSRAPELAGDAPPPLRVGARFGRYVIGEWLGSGGMGVVHRAYDPELDRHVALKTWRPPAATPHTSRSLVDLHAREAKAMAQVSHPNVIHVYETGVIDGRLFLAMEFVDGQTLREWQQGAHTWEGVLAMYVQAGRGLAAAHAAKIIHRDFKPENVLVGRDGRARVMDFGLARRESSPVEASHAAQSRTRSGGPDLGHRAHAISAIAGTPAYMAPEQRAGAASIHSDQYSFCVALYEALYGSHPFPALRRARPRGQPPRSRSVPSWVRSRLQRGMSFAPEARYASMAELLAALERDPRAAWQRRARWALPVLAASVVGYAAHRARPPAHDRCDSTDPTLDGIWDEGRKEAARTAFAATGSPDAPATLERVERALDGYAASWVRARAAACDPTIRPAPPYVELDHRLACLERLSLGLRAVTDALLVADGRTVRGAVALVDGLERVEDCAAGSTHRPRAPLPSDPAVRSRVEAATGRLSELRVLQMTGRFEEASQLVTAVDAEARAIGYAPLETETQIRVGLFDMQAGRYAEAAQRFHDAIASAERAEDDRLRAYAATKLAVVLGRYEKKYAEAALATKFAEAAIERAGREDALRAELEDDLAGVEHQRKNLVGAREHALLSVRFRSAAYGEGDHRVGEGRYHLAVIESSLGNDEAAITAVVQAVPTLEAAYAGDHPNLAFALDLQSDLLARSGRCDEALPIGERALAMLERARPPLTHEVIGATCRLAAVFTCLERYAVARRHLERAHERGRDELGATARKTTLAQAMLARVLRLEGHHDAALATAQRALDAVGTREWTEPRLNAFAAIGAAHLALGRPGRAKAALERGLALPASDADATLYAELEFTMARALWASERASTADRARARRLAEQALERLAGRHTKASTELSSWLEAHR